MVIALKRVFFTVCLALPLSMPAFGESWIRRELDSYQPAGVFAAIGKNGCVYQ